MDIDASVGQGNSMLSDMSEHNQAIKQHNDDLLQGYNKALTTARGQFTAGMKSDTIQAIQEGGLNVGAKFSKVALAKGAVNKSGRNYLSSEEAWGKGPGKVKAGVTKAGQAIESGRSSFKPSAVGTTEAGTFTGAGEEATDISTEGHQETSGGLAGEATGERVGEGTTTSGDLDPGASLDEDHYSAPAEATPVTQTRASGEAPKAAGSTDTSSSGGGDSTGSGESSVAQGDKDFGKMAAKATDVASKIGTGLSMTGGLLDLTADISKGHIAGDNTWEKMSNVAGIAAGGIDALSEAVPIFAPLGAAAGLFSAVTEGIGLIEHKDKETKKAKADIAGKGPDPSDKAPAANTQSLQSAGLIASSGGNPTSHVTGAGAF